MIPGYPEQRPLTYAEWLARRGAAPSAYRSPPMPQQGGGADPMGVAMELAGSETVRDTVGSYLGGEAAAAAGAEAVGAEAATAASQAAWNSGAMAANSSSVGANAAAPSWISMNPGLAGAGIFAATVAATPYVDKYVTPAAEKGMDFVNQKLWGNKKARPMSDQEVRANTGNARAMLGNDSQEAIQFAIDNDLLRRSMTKNDAGEDMSGLDRNYGARYGLFSGRDIYADALRRKRQGSKGGSGWQSGMATPYEGPLAKQLEYMDSAGASWGPDVAKRAEAARQLLGMYPGQGAPMAQPAAPTRSSTSSPGIGKDGRRIQY